MTIATENRIRLMTRAQVRASDEAWIRGGVPGVILMENAGRGAAEAIRAIARNVRSATILVGAGNNGGDGFVVARHLRLAGWDVAVWALDAAKCTGDAAIMRDAWRALDGSIHDVGNGTSVPLREALRTPVVIDALFGTGLSRPLSGAALAVVHEANAYFSARDLSIALDVPSGLDVDTGAPLGPDDGVFRATHTMTFALSKPGLHTGFGVRVAGEVAIVPIGVPTKPGEGDGTSIELVHEAPCAPRRIDAHKGDNGRVLVVGGSPGTTGAALLTARGAHRGGAGLVTIASRAAATLEHRVLETMTIALAADEAAALATLDATFPTADTVCVGPGLGRDDWARSIVTFALEHAACLVLDADGLTLLASMSPVTAGRIRVLTPHPLEMARLLGRPGASSVNSDRIESARECATKFDAIAVLKGAGTVIAEPHGRVAIIACAEPTLAVAGSGDVLAGVIAARLAERGSDDPFERVVEAVMAHARAGVRVRDARGATRGALAGEIADAVSAELERDAT